MERLTRTQDPYFFATPLTETIKCATECYLWDSAVEWNSLVHVYCAR